MKKIHVVKRKNFEKFEQWKFKLFVEKKHADVCFVFRFFEIRNGHVLLTFFVDNYKRTSYFTKRMR